MEYRGGGQGGGIGACLGRTRTCCTRASERGTSGDGGGGTSVTEVVGTEEEV